MADHHDDVLSRAIDELRTLPPLDDAAVARIVAAAARAREAGPAEDDDLGDVRRGRIVPGKFFRWPAVAGIAAAAAFAGFAAGMWGVDRGSMRAPAGSEVVASASPARSGGAPQAIPASAVAPEGSAVALVPTQFVFESRVARRVTLVGDFNGWNERATPLVREPGSSAWSVTVPLRPGRHVYAFMVDDTLLQTDPRAPETKDPDFGVTGSVLIVGAP